MTLDEAKKIARRAMQWRDDTGGHQTGEEADAIHVLLSALGEPTAEAREAAGFHRNRADECNRSGATTWARMHRLAADALERNPDAIRRAALEEAAKVADSIGDRRKPSMYGDYEADAAYECATAIRALATGPTPPPLPE